MLGRKRSLVAEDPGVRCSETVEDAHVRCGCQWKHHFWTKDAAGAQALVSSRMMQGLGQRERWCHLMPVTCEGGRSPVMMVRGGG